MPTALCSPVVARKMFSLRAIASAIDKGYCAYEGLQHDPLLANVRGSSECA
jgi:hypothetical protein